MLVQLLLVVFVAYAQAQKVLISSPYSYFSDAGTSAFNLTFDGCVEFDPYAQIVFQSATQAKPSGVCTQTTTQQWRCTFNPQVSSVEYEYRISLPASSVTITGLPNIASNFLRLKYVPAVMTGRLTHKFMNVPNTLPEGSIVEFLFEANQDLVQNLVVPAMVSMTNSSSFKLLYASFPTKSSYKFAVASTAGANITATVHADGFTSLVPYANKTSKFMNAAVTKNILVQIGGVNCAVTEWSPWTGCSGDPTSDCATFDNSFNWVYVNEVRFRSVTQPASGDGIPCPTSLEEIRRCSETACSGIDTSRPRSGESLSDCGGQDCRATNPLSSEDSYLERSRCSCSPTCETQGNCCQAYYTKNCCPGGNCAANFASNVFKGSFPLSCSLADCTRGDKRVNPSNPSYFCYCDARCTQEQTCCGGSAARAAVCLGA